MADPKELDADQLAYWNGAGGRAWAARQAHVDRVIEPALEALLALADPRSGEAALDIGCGCGTSTLAVAGAVGRQGRVTALDISGPMLEEARRRAEAAGLDNITWLQEDAARASLQGYDLLVSSFGLMFFGDPVAGFTNLRRAAHPGARMAFVCWRPLAENTWLELTMRTLARHLPPRPDPASGAPGMFAFSDPARVSGILTAAGWSAPRFERLDYDLDIAAGRGLEEAVIQATRFGAASSWLRDQPDEVAEAAVDAVRKALAEHQDGDSVRLPGAMWLVSAAPA